MILFIIGKYISKLSPSANVNKNGKSITKLGK